MLVLADRNAGQLPDQLADAPTLPAYLTFVWTTFWELSAARGSNGFGLDPIRWTDLHAWQQLTRTQLAPWEVRAVLAIDRVFRQVMGAKDGDRPRED